MGEKNYPVEVLEIAYECDCGHEIKSTGITDTRSKPTLYQHRCKACGEVKVFDKEYPNITYIRSK